MSRVAMLPAIVQTDGVLVVKVTGKPELAVALNVSGELRMNLLPGEAKVTV